jgi:hypothetical protein
VYEGVTGTHVDVPRLETEDQLARILSARLSPFDVNVPLSTIVDEEAVTAIFRHYLANSDMTIRRSLTLTKLATELAWDAGADRVSPGHVSSARADLD